MSARLESLADVEAACWRELALAVNDTAHPWRTPVLATADGDHADARTVVLREARAPELWVYTDARATKVAQIGARPSGTLVMWSVSLGWQLRCRVRLKAIVAGSEVDARWQTIQASRSAVDYLAPTAPGTPLAAPTSASPITGAHFAVIVASVVSLDWLELHRDGHRRARFDAGGVSRWLQP